MVLNSSLKTGIAEEQYKRFFRLSSYAIAYIENDSKSPNGYSELTDIDAVIKEISELDKIYNIFDKLLSVSVVTKSLNTLAKSKSKDDYLLLILDIDKKEISVRQSESKEELESYYSFLESQYRNNHNKDVVMISVGDMKNLKRAYPNYFLDAKDFVKTIRDLIEKLKNKTSEK